MKLIYGISGEKGHGKDTLAKYVLAADNKFTILHFADDLKSMVGAIWGLLDYQLYDEVGKEEIFIHPINMDHSLTVMNEYTCLDIQPKGKIANSPRQLLQYFGTDYVRSVDDNYWINRVISQIERIGDKILIPDTRYPNECAALRKIGATIIKVQRVDLPKSANSEHSSETSVAAIEPDVLYTFQTSDSDLERMEGIAEGLAQGELSDIHDPRAYMDMILDGFNQSFSDWCDFHRWGANIGVEYNSQTGKKKFVILDMGPEASGKPTQGDPRIAAAGHIVKEALRVAEQAENN